jgi:DNA-directed RNA polymerase specialized sigma24 family protein
MFLTKPHKGEGGTADTFNHLARGLAALAFQPGGVRFNGTLWCAEHAPWGAAAGEEFACRRCGDGEPAEPSPAAGRGSGRASARGRGAVTELRHGYTLADLDVLAKSAAANNHTMAADHRDLYHAAWSAIVDLLYASEYPPARHDLAREGKAAIWRLVRDHRQTYGYHDRDWYNGIGFRSPRFATYWHQPAEAPYEERFTDHLAVGQVFAALPARLQQVLLAAAAHDGDYIAAATALDMPPGSRTGRG